MAVQSVSSNVSACTQSSTPASQAQSAERREQRPEERVERKEEAPRPVTNAQGQTTGTLIDVTAWRLVH